MELVWVRLAWYIPIRQRCLGLFRMNQQVQVSSLPSESREPDMKWWIFRSVYVWDTVNPPKKKWVITIPFGYLTSLWRPWPIYRWEKWWFTYWTWWFSMATLNNQRIYNNIGYMGFPGSFCDFHHLHLRRLHLAAALGADMLDVWVQDHRPSGLRLCLVGLVFGPMCFRASCSNCWLKAMDGFANSHPHVSWFCDVHIGL